MVSASAGVANAELQRVEPFDLKQLRRFAPTLISGWIAEEFSRDVATCTRASREEAVDAVGQQLRGFMPGDNYGDLAYRTSVSWESLEPVLVPVWVLRAAVSRGQAAAARADQRADRRGDRARAAVVVEGDAGGAGGGRGDRGDRARAAGASAVTGAVDPVAGRACGRCESPLEAGDLRCAVCALPAPLRPPHVVVEAAKIVRCTECNAAVAFSPDVQAPRCAFCGAVTAIEQPVDPIEAAMLAVPFAVDRASATASLRAWLARRGWFAPSALTAEAVVEQLVPIQWASWIVNARANVAWTADSDAGSRRAAWAPHAGEVQLEFGNLCVPASRGLDHGECSLLVPYYDLTAVKGVTEAAAAAEADVVVESFEAQRSAARKHVHAAIEAVAKTRVEPRIPGRRFRNVKVACMVERLSTDRVALPAWVMAYRFRSRVYRAIVHGQRREVVFGTSPIDPKKVALVVAAIAAVIFGIVVLLATRR